MENRAALAGQLEPKGTMIRIFKSATATLCCLFLASLASAAPLPERVRFNEHIRPILSNNCFYCHGPDEKHREAHLRLDVRDAATADLGGYAAIVPGQPEKSELITRVTSTDPDESMPTPKSKKPHLSENEIALLHKWIAQGAEYEEHWAFLPLRDEAPPQVADAQWARNPIDAFIRARLDREHIAPSPEAEAATLCRRLHLDLTGLLPTPEDVAAFTKASAANRDAAVAQLADQLLASPHYGERWGRHWLDQARYADSNGFSVDGARTMWPYRDWVIAALNNDMPFDRFTTEQLAGDLLPHPTKSQIVATAFHRNTLINEEGGSNPEQFRVDSVIDRVNTTGAVWLGLTVGCAQCHTHKFDPITHREFYEMFAFFNQGLDVNNKGATIPVTRGEMFGGPAAAAGDTVSDAELSRVEEAWEKTEIARLSAVAGEPTPLLLALRELAAARSPEQHKLVKDAFEKAEPRARKPKLRSDDLDASSVELLVMRDIANPRPNYLFLRGDFLRPNLELGPLQPGVIAAVGVAMTPGAPMHNRLDLARWLIAPENPLAPRVTMNRMWMHYFGRGLVETEEDFGAQGSAPTHPELLDFLGREFIRRGWSMKAMHRLIVTSRTYRQSSRARPDLAELDPRNLLLARQERLRVEAEIVRDAALCASGLLDPTIGGPGNRPPQPEGVYAFTQTSKTWKTSPAPARFRRGLYTIFFRSAPYPLFGTFDTPEMNTTCTRRIRSDTPLQSLTLANDPAFIEIAHALAARIEKECTPDDSKLYVLNGRKDDKDTILRQRLSPRLHLGFRLCLGRDASDKEMEILMSYTLTQPPAEALFCAARALLNLDNFITRE